MPFYSSPLDGCQLHYIDYRPSTPAATTLIFLHGWPMSSAMYAHLFLPLLSAPTALRLVALDRRGFGKSEYTGCTPPADFSITYDTFACDTLALLSHLDEPQHGDLGPFIFVAASMGCGESLLAYDLLRAPAREKCKGFVWMGPSLPFPLATPTNPRAPPRELWDAILAGLRDDRYAFTAAAVPGIFGNGVIEGCVVGEEDLEAFGKIIALADPVAMERCIAIITGRDFTRELKGMKGRVGGGEGGLGLLVLHGEGDQSMPYEASSKIIKELVPGTEVKLYEKAAHGLYLTHKKQVLEDVLKFVDGLHVSTAAGADSASGLVPSPVAGNRGMNDKTFLLGSEQ